VADTNQRKELEDIFQGRKGGPMEVISKFAPNWLPTTSTKIDINDDGHNLTAKVGSFGQIKSEQLKNESGQAMTLHGASFASVFQMENETFALVPSATQWSDPEMPRQFSTRSGAVANFSWRGS
jgi:hypothetical protein